jgi:outer membrane protein assembly factor BamE (lipoprotein component of BamABCDE complex)
MKYFFSVLLVFLSACTSMRYCDRADKLTTGIVQREIHIGMPASDVAAILGAPNIVSLDENKDEVWVYDKVSSEVQYCSQRSGVWLLIAGSGSESGYARRNQRTLTIIIKFDAGKQVKDFTYHSSSF